MPQFSLQYIILYIVSLIVTQEMVVSKITKHLNRKVFDVGRTLKYNTDDNKDNKKNLMNLADVRERLCFITKLISYFEAVLIMSLSYFIFLSDKPTVDAVMLILSAVAGWMAIKIIGNYSQWSDYAIGRSTYYVFLIGSILNILIAIIFGLALSLLV